MSENNKPSSEDSQVQKTENLMEKLSKDTLSNWMETLVFQSLFNPVSGTGLDKLGQTPEVGIIYCTILATPQKYQN